MSQARVPHIFRIARSAALATVVVCACALPSRSQAGPIGGGGSGAHQSNPGGGAGHGGVRPRVNGALVGRFNAVVAGAVTGAGRADVDRTMVRVNIAVSTEDGRQGTLIAPALPISGRHFAGPGQLMGQPVQVFGRLDSAKASRLSALVVTIDGQFIRLVGFNPADPGNPNWATPPGNGSGGQNTSAGGGNPGE